MSPLPVRDQLIAIAQLRWCMFVNRLRSKRGKLELVSRGIITLAFGLAGLAGFGIATGVSWWLVSQDKTEFLAAVLWPIFFFWQFFPVMATAFTNNPDSSDLLRFPLVYRSYFLIRLAYGFFDPASALSSVAIIGVFLGTTAARPSLAPWAALVLATYAIFNLTLMQAVFAWLERWLAQRRTREVLGVVFILFMLSFQLIGPMVQRFEREPQGKFAQAAQMVSRIQGMLPPGIAANSIGQASHAEYGGALISFVILLAVTAAVGWVLHVRLHAQFRGENLSEAAARPATPLVAGVSPGWDLPGFSPSVAAVFEKEVRYVGRSGPMLLTLIMPLFMLIIFRIGPMSAMHQSNFFHRAPDMAFPSAAAYSLLVLTNLVYNSFGGDGGGIQFFYASPVNFRQIVLGKNLTHFAILVANVLITWIAVSYFYGAPRLAITVATISGLLFAAPLNFTAGNLLSIYAPKKRDFAAFGRQNVAQTTVLASLGVQGIIVGAGIAAFALARAYQNLWIAVLIFLILAAVSVPLYVVLLRRMDGIALDRRETLMGELCRA